MKKIITLAALIISAVSLHAQHRVGARVQSLAAEGTRFVPYAPLTESTSVKQSEGVKTATYATVNREVVTAIAAQAPQFIELALPYNNAMVTVQLYRSDVTAEGFHADTPTQKNVPYTEGAHYRGSIKGDATSLASFSFFKNELSGLISSKQLSNLVIGRLNREKNYSDYIIYADRQLNKTNNFSCATADEGIFGKKPQQAKGIRGGGGLTECVGIFFDIDHDIYLQNGSSTEQTLNWMTALFNNIQTLFENDGISVALASTNIWTTPDPYFDAGEGSTDYLMQFAEQYWEAGFDGDLGQLIGIDDGGLGGLAALAGLCDFNFSYVDVDIDFEDVPMFSWNVEAMTHEIGHQLGSPHTHSCFWNGNDTPIDGCGQVAGAPEGDCEEGPLPTPEEQGTIMSYCHLIWEIGIDLSNGFGPQPTALMIDYINSELGCLGGFCPTACDNMVESLQVSDITMNSATFILEGETEGANLEIAVVPYGVALGG